MSRPSTQAASLGREWRGGKPICPATFTYKANSGCYFSQRFLAGATNKVSSMKRPSPCRQYFCFSLKIMRTRDEGKATAGKGLAPFCDVKNKVKFFFYRFLLFFLRNDVDAPTFFEI